MSKFKKFKINQETLNSAAQWIPYFGMYKCINDIYCGKLNPSQIKRRGVYHGAMLMAISTGIVYGTKFG